MKKLFWGFLSLIILSQFLAAGILFFAEDVYAQAPAPASATKPLTDIREVKLNVPIPNMEKFGAVKSGPCPGQKGAIGESTRMCIQVPWMAQYIRDLYRYGVLIGSIAAVIALMLGGIGYMISGMNQKLLARSKQMITGAATGLLLLLSAHLLLGFINPDLVDMKPINVEVVKQVAMLGATFCSEVEKENFTVDTAKPGSRNTAGASWNTGDTPTCGEKFTVKMTAAATSSGTVKSGGGETCISDYCGAATGSCVVDMETNEYACRDVFMYGQIVLPNQFNFTMCGLSVDAIKGLVQDTVLVDSFYIDSIQLKYRFPKSTETFQDLTDKIPVGKTVKSYTISSSQVKVSPGEISGWPANTEIFMVVETNEAAWLHLPTIDKDSTVSGFKNDSEAGTNVSSVKFCKIGDSVKVFKKVGQLSDKLNEDKQGIGKIWKEVPAENLLLASDIKTKTQGIRWNINVTQNFFSCKDTADFREPSCTEMSILDACAGVDGAGANCGRAREIGECDLTGAIPGALTGLAWGPAGVIYGGLSAFQIECMTSKIYDDNLCKANLVCNKQSLTCTCNAAGTGCENNGDCGDGYCNQKSDPKSCLAYNAAEGAACEPGRTIKRGGTDQINTGSQVCKYNADGGSGTPPGLLCDEGTKTCIKAPPKCSNDNDCSSKEFSTDGKCVNSYCDCNEDDDCDDGYKCRNNSTELYAENDTCVQMGTANLGERCVSGTDDNCGANAYCDPDNAVCVAAPPACDPAIEGEEDARGMTTYQCKTNLPGWNDGKCEGNWCDCDSNECSSGYRCVSNKTFLTTNKKFNGNDSCVSD
jgi:hypothetical protein